MKDLQEYLLNLLNEDGGLSASTPAATMGMGEIGPGTDPISAPAGGIPKEETKIYKRRKKKRKDIRDFLMGDDIHKV